MIRKLALAALFALCGSAAEADTFNVAIDGHCNTFTLNVQRFLVAGTRGGCGSAIEGGTVAKVDRKRGVVISETTDNMVVTWYFTTPEAGAGKVFVFSSDGETSSEVGSGTYHIVHNSPAAAGASGPDIMAAFQKR
jgi:hypothetical protein